MPDKVRGYDVVALYDAPDEGLGVAHEAWQVVAGQRRERVILRVFDTDDADVTNALDRAERLLTAYDPGLLRVVEVLRIPARAVAMEWIEPGDTVYEHSPMPAARVVEVAIATAATLAYLHGLEDIPDQDGPGLIHGGVVTEVVYASATKTRLLEPWLGPLRGAQTRARDGWTAPPWYAPEHVDGTGDERSDIYGLGLAMYEAVAGEPLYDLSDTGTPQEWLLKRRKLDVGDALRKLPKGLRGVVERCVRHDPGARYQSAGDVVEALRGVVEPASDPTAGMSPDLAMPTTMPGRMMAPAAMPVVAPMRGIVNGAAPSAFSHRRSARKGTAAKAFAPFFLAVE